MTSSSSEASQISKFNSALNSLPIHLSPTNYLVWLNQMTPLFEYHELYGHIDGSLPPPVESTIVDGKSTPNPEYKAWKSVDQKAIILLHNSLSEEVFPDVVGYSTAREKWLALAAIYSDSSIERVQNLKDQLNSITKGTQSVAEFGRRFKALVDQLAAIGHPMSETDKTHSYYRGLGPSFENFSIALKAAQPNISLRELQARAENSEIFSRSIHGTQPSVAFSAQANRTSPNRTNYRGKGSNRAPYRGNFRGGRGGRGGRFYQPDPCQWCGKPGHKASNCYNLLNQTASNSSGVLKSKPTEEQVAQAFKAKCQVQDSKPDWYVDSGATDHMVGSSSQTNTTASFSGSCVEENSSPWSM
ncbi:hypothetical protein SSX86_025384 [Deinandra increscens subsp. villosa]|uniref:CCHC-type domain-containing protein n=1 Tax=Deinandra increscens subsp. villosa TaxID=3103831 RepID=A0AAP0CE45_9ASTR